MTSQKAPAPVRLRTRLFLGSLWIVSIALAALAFLSAPRGSTQPPSAAGRAPGSEVRISGAAPSTWDPALQGDAATASLLAQLHEGLTAFDANAEVQPALAARWRVEENGQRIVFELRPDLRFSDGSPLRAQDVVDSWFRLIDPQRDPPAPLASLLSDVVGADAYLRGEVARDRVGLRAEGETVVVDLRRPAAYFLAVTASPSLAVVSPGVGDSLATERLPRRWIGSGAYVPNEQSDTKIRLEANANYWAGEPPIGVIHVVTDLEGESPVAAFEAGDLDYTGIAGSDAPWIRYDRTLGPQLRELDSFSVTYYGFDTTRPPFSDPRVRRAFGQAVDWDRLVRLADASEEPATSLVPSGVAGRSETDFSPRHDPEAARKALADAGFPGGRGFPAVRLTTSGLGYDAAIVAELRAVLGVEVALETMPFGMYFQRLDSAPPQFWAVSWVADYPAPHDFLGLLLQTGSSNNYGGWSDPAYDAALDAAGTTENEADQAAAYDAAQLILVEQVPVIPVSYGRGWALSRTGLLGATESSVGLIRFAGLEWTEQ